jgi:dihydrofolate reductase
MELIAAVDKNWGIGYENKLLCHIPEDLKNFKELTIGRHIIMGANTFKSLPHQEPLKDRTNIILSKTLQQKDFNYSNVIVYNDFEKLLNVYETDYKLEDAIVIGGGKIYNLFLPYCHTAYITKIDKEFKVDTYCPNLDRRSDWQIASESSVHTYEDLNYSFQMYINNNYELKMCEE